MRRAGGLLLAGLMLAGVCRGQAPGTAIHFVNGLWFNGTGFVKDDLYAVGGVFARKVPAGMTVKTEDLHGGYVVPPFGDAHEHNFDNLATTPKVTQAYLRDGIFYAQGMTDVTSGARAVVAAGLVNTPATVDVTYAHGALTAPQGHPKEVYESLANGFYFPANEEQRRKVLEGNLREGDAYWQIDSVEELAAKWPKILATKPDLIKIILTDSEHFTAESHAHPELGKGLDPSLVRPITERAHAAGLKVAAHVDTATDVHAALVGGVDELGHMPGYGQTAGEDPGKYRLADADIALAAKRHVPVQATAGIFTDERTPPADVKARQAMQRDNLTRLKAAGVTVLVGSDHYGQDSLHEADYLQALGVWSNAEMLRMWAVATPRDVFPKRKIGELREGYEASFLVLGGNPLENWGAVHAIRARWKQGFAVEGVE